jgi:UDP-N-acetylmuramate dehydrogenase
VTDFARIGRALEAIGGVSVQAGVPMASRTSLGVGGPADLLVRVREERALVPVLATLDDEGCPWMTAGLGTNLLVTDDGIEGAVVGLQDAFDSAVFDGTGNRPQLLAGAARGIVPLLADVTRAGRSGLEFLTGIPGTLGGAVVMNAGTLYGYLDAALIEVRVATAAGESWVRASELRLGYRTSVLPRDSVIAAARLALAPFQTPEAEAVATDLDARRRAGHPPMKGTCGSFFRNPDPAGRKYAGRLIEESGLKGVRVGGAWVSPVHANFLSNAGGASARDLLELAVRVRDEVLRTSGERLIPEVRIVGRGSGEWRARLGCEACGEG